MGMASQSKDKQDKGNLTSSNGLKILVPSGDDRWQNQPFSYKSDTWSLLH